MVSSWVIGYRIIPLLHLVTNILTLVIPTKSLHQTDSIVIIYSGSESCWCVQLTNQKVNDVCDWPIRKFNVFNWPISMDHNMLLVVRNPSLKENHNLVRTVSDFTYIYIHLWHQWSSAIRNIFPKLFTKSIILNFYILSNYLLLMSQLTLISQSDGQFLSLKPRITLYIND